MDITETTHLSLHVPEPAVRPGDQPDFSNVKIPKAGSVPRPEVGAAPEDMRDLAYSIIRVLNHQGEAVGPWAGLLSDEDLLVGLKNMMRLRAFDARMLMAQRQGVRPPFTCSIWARKRSVAPSARRFPKAT